MGNDRGRGGEREVTRAPLTQEHKEYMLAHLLRLPSLFNLAREEMRQEYFAPDERAYAVLWRAALQLAERYLGSMPPAGAARRLELELRGILSDDVSLTPEELSTLFGAGDVQGLIGWVYGIPDDELLEIDGKRLFQQFLEERAVVAPLQAYLSGLGGRIPQGLDERLRRVDAQLGLIGGITRSGAVAAFNADANYRPVALQLTSTGVSFLDEMMEGGAAPGEVYYLMGPTGVGKTLAGLQIAYSGALTQQLLASQGATLGHWYYFTYEQPVEPDLIQRLWSCAADIHIDTFRKGEEFSTSASLKPYERLRYAKRLERSEDVPGELERLNAQRTRMTEQANLWLKDMSGGDKTDPYAGSGGLPEVERFLDAEVRRGRKVAGFVIDYVELVVDRYLRQKNVSDDRRKYNELKTFGDVSRQRLAEKCGCSGWLLHQLAGAANKRRPTAAQHHSDGSGCKSMADNAAFAFNLGTKDRDSSTCLISCSKSRRASGDDKQRVLYVDGAFGKMEAADTQFTLDRRTNRIVPKALKDRIASPEAIDAAKREAAARAAAADPAAAIGRMRPSMDMS